MLAVILSACLEYYNYMLLTFMLKNPAFLMDFFPANAYSTSILHGYFFLLICALMRPFGALFFGWIGDKYSRTTALFWSMILMSVSAFTLSACATYTSVGHWCIVCLFICRVAQIISASGESNGVAIFLIEQLGDKRAGMASGMAFGGTMLGAAMASGASTILRIYHISWRYAFFIGGFVAMTAMIMKFAMHEESSNKTIQVKSKDPIMMYVTVILVSAATSAGFYYISVFLSGYWIQMLSQAGHQANELYNIFLVLFYAGMLFAIGTLSDYVSLFKLMKAGSAGLMALLPVSYYMILNNPTSIWILPILYLTIISLSMLSGPLHSFLYRFFPKHKRYKAVSLCYSIAAATIGFGTIPISGYLRMINASYGWIFIWCVMLSALVSLIASERIWNKMNSIQ